MGDGHMHHGHVHGSASAETDRRALTLSLVHLERLDRPDAQLKLFEEFYQPNSIDQFDRRDTISACQTFSGATNRPLLLANPTIARPPWFSKDRRF